MNRKILYTTTAFVVTILVLTIVFASTLPLLIPTSGTYNTAMNLTVNPTSIDWGAVEVGVNVTRTANITNAGGTNVVSLNFTTATYVGISAENFTLTCDLQGQPLTVKTSKIATFTLKLLDPVSATFSFDIVVDE